MPLEVVLNPRLPGEQPFLNVAVSLDRVESLERRSEGEELRRGIATRGNDIWLADLIFDSGATDGWRGRPSQISPTVTRTNAHRLWNLARGRRLTLSEVARLQGFASGDFVWYIGVH